MRQAWNGRQFGGPLIIEGTVSKISDSGDTLTFRVNTDGVFRTLTMVKADARIRVTEAGIMITEEASNA